MTSGRRRLGIVGGLGPKATSDLYVSVVANVRRENGGTSPDIAISSVPVSRAVEDSFIRSTGNASSSRGATTLLERAVDALDLMGAQAIAMPCNTLHPLLRPIADSFSLPMIDIVEASMARVAASGARRVLIVGTETTCVAHLYTEHSRARAIEPVTLSRAERRIVACAIVSLLRGREPSIVAPTVWSSVTTVDADAIVLACTELHEIAAWAPSSLLVIDSLDALRDACVEWLLTGRSTPGPLERAAV